ncbi:hypothetical protein ABZY57_26225 [Streptomyces sp. NPDC006450]|uniref:hypothetical protein n=1 Tax=Streptomyces sp. NPDC006450 TaxID=3155458 RepID=UPI0033B89741
MKLSRMGAGVALLGAAVPAVLASTPAQAAVGEVGIRHVIFTAHCASCVRDSTAQVDVTFNSAAEPGPAPTSEPATGWVRTETVLLVGGAAAAAAAVLGLAARRRIARRSD